MSRYSTKFKRWFWSDKVQIEIRSFFHTWLSVMIVDGVLELMTVYNGDISTSALIALAMASVRSAVKAIFQLALPQVFTVGTSRSGDVGVTLSKGIDPNKKKNYN